jgi:hypothetical protein
MDVDVEYNGGIDSEDKYQEAVTLSPSSPCGVSEIPPPSISPLATGRRHVVASVCNRRPQLEYMCRGWRLRRVHVLENTKPLLREEQERSIV